MTDTPSFQDLLNDFADEVFVGRGEQLTLFEGALKVSQPAFLILNISGQGGVGKTTLLERYCQISKNNEVAYASVTDDHLAVPKILEVFVAQLEEDGLDFDTFNERYRKYLELKEKVEADPKVPSGLMDFALRGIAKVGVKSLKRIPVAGDVADVFLSPESEEAIVEQASEFTKYIFQKFTNKDERVLLLDTDAELTRYFLADITEALKDKRAVLCFDTYEKTAESIEKWLINLLLGGYGQFSRNILFVIAGRYSLGQNQNWTRFRKAIRQIELQEFTEDEAKDYLTRAGITDEQLISQFIEISERLPVLLALLVSSPNQLPHDISGDAIQRFLQGLTPEQQEAALISSLPRYFNRDILTSILGEEEGKKAFEWLSKAHFVRTSEKGWVYHDVVRAMMLRYFRMRSGQQFIELHERLEEDYQKQIVNSVDSVDNLKTVIAPNEFEAERIYHFLYQNPKKNFEYVARRSLKEIGKVFRFSMATNDADNSSEKLGLWMQNLATVLQQLSDEISEFSAKELTENYKQFSKLLLGESAVVNLKDFTWLNNIKNLDNDEENGMLVIELLSKATNEKDFDTQINLGFLDKLINLNPDMAVCYLARADYHKTHKNYDLAFIDFSKAFELHPEDGDNYYQRGLVYYDMEDYLNALTDLSKAIELQPEDGDNYFWRGATYYQIKDYSNALADFSKSIELQPENGGNYNWRGSTYYQIKDYSNALTDFSKAIELQPENGDNYNSRGSTYYQIKDYSNALTDFSKSIELQPENGGNYNWRGRTYYQIKDYSSALSDFSKAIELLPEYWGNYNWRGSTYYETEDYHAALTDFSKAIELQPEDGGNYNWRGQTYDEMKDYPNALTDFSKVIELQPENESNHWWRGQTYYEMKDYPNALADLSKAIELKPEEGYNYSWRGLTYSAMKVYSSAVTDFSKAIELQPENGGNYNWRGQAYYEMKDYPAALTDFSKALELQPEDGTTYYWRGQAYYEMKDYPAALTDFSKAIELQPENGDDYFWRGLTYYQMKDYSSALTDFSKAIELQPEDGDNYRWRGLTYYQMKDYSSALTDFSKAIELQPEDGDNYRWRGRTHYEMKDYSNALTEYSKAIKLKPEKGSSYYRRALCHYVVNIQDSYIKDIQNALPLFKTDYEKDKNSSAAFMMALCLLANNEIEQAKKLYKEVINQHVEKEDLTRALENLEEFMNLTGKTIDIDFILRLLNEALANSS